MKYMGSKARHAKELLPIILANRKEGQWYVEPFVGGANMIDKVKGNRIGADINEYLISLWQSVSTGWNAPLTFKESEYKVMRDDKENYDKTIVGYVGFALSYSGKWFGGWCRDGAGKRDYVLESYKNACNQFPKLRGVKFENKSYSELDIPTNSIIYCDPPYKDTTKYKDNFNHEPFYDWCRQMYKEGHQVFVSEYSMPDDFICVWSKEVNNSLTKDTGSKKGIEKLFTLKNND
jgi:DNA adenine methylase